MRTRPIAAKLNRETELTEITASTMRKHLTYANVLSTVSVFLALGGGAYALGSGFAVAGALRGCVDKKTGALRLVKPGKRCHRRETAVVWNQHGQPGPQGAAGIGSPGPQGSPGRQGDPGPAGVAAAFQARAGAFPASPVAVPFSPPTAVISLS